MAGEPQRRQRPTQVADHGRDQLHELCFEEHRRNNQLVREWEDIESKRACQRGDPSGAELPARGKHRQHEDHNAAECALKAACRSVSVCKYHIWVERMHFPRFNVHRLPTYRSTERFTWKIWSRFSRTTSSSIRTVRRTACATASVYCPVISVDRSIPEKWAKSSRMPI